MTWWLILYIMTSNGTVHHAYPYSSVSSCRAIVEEHMQVAYSEGDESESTVVAFCAPGQGTDPPPTRILRNGKWYPVQNQVKE